MTGASSIPTQPERYRAFYNNYFGRPGGTNDPSGTIASSYASGAVSPISSDGPYVGGLIGWNDEGQFTSSYWVTTTSGQRVAVGVGPVGSNAATGLTMIQIENGGSSLGPDFAGGAGGLYPYLKFFYPGGVQAISGTAYADGGSKPLASGRAGAQTVSVLVAGGAALTTTTGVNGDYYLIEPAGTADDAHTPTIVYTSDGARVTAGAGQYRNLDIWGATLIASTAAATLSSASSTSLQSQDAALIAGAIGPNTALAAMVANLSNYGYVKNGDFTVDIAPTASIFAQTRGQGQLTLTAPIILKGATAAELDASGKFVIDATVKVDGAGRVGLAYNPSLPTNLYFAPGDSIDFSGAAAGATLFVNKHELKLLSPIYVGPHTRSR